MGGSLDREPADPHRAPDTGGLATGTPGVGCPNHQRQNPNRFGPLDEDRGGGLTCTFSRPSGASGSVDRGLTG
ncbi:MAG: hypothetical protein FWD11_06690 [Micrococcales bacterium]|nr:hypothetical protein [Micrococcales bacterium]